MAHVTASFTPEICRIRAGATQHKDRSNEIANLLDGLIARFDLTKDGFPLPANSIMEEAPHHTTTFFSFFPNLSAEIQNLIFGFSCTYYVVKLYSEDQIKVNAGRAASRSQSSLLDTQTPPRVIFGIYRSVRTIPLLHTCQASRELAIMRYGFPSPNTLLFDPSIDVVRHCGQWPYPATPKFSHIFGIGEQLVCDLSRTKSLQLHVPGFSVGTGLCLPLDCLFNNFEPLNSVAADLAQAVGWIRSHMPQLEELIFTISLETWDKLSATDYLEALVEKHDSIRVDLINIRSGLVTLEESRFWNSEPAYLPRLSSVAIQLVPDDAKINAT